MTRRKHLFCTTTKKFLMNNCITHITLVVWLDADCGLPTGLTSQEDDWTRYYWNEEKKMYCPKKKVIYEPC